MTETYHTELYGGRYVLIWGLLCLRTLMITLSASYESHIFGCSTVATTRRHLLSAVGAIVNSHRSPISTFDDSVSLANTHLRQEREHYPRRILYYSGSPTFVLSWCRGRPWRYRSLCLKEHFFDYFCFVVPRRFIILRILPLLVVWYQLDSPFQTRITAVTGASRLVFARCSTSTVDTCGLQSRAWP